MSEVLTLTRPLKPFFSVGLGGKHVVEGKIFLAFKASWAQLKLSSSGASSAVELFPVHLETNSYEFFASIDANPSIVGFTDRIQIQFFADTYTGSNLDHEGRQSAEFDLGECEWTDMQLSTTAAIIGEQSRPLIAVCMATYNPPVDSFDRQIDSLFAQDYDHWRLIITDDGSDETHWQYLVAAQLRDPTRIEIHRNETNLGFYHNFERCLQLVPQEAEYIAFADQDDKWYPQKLSALLQACTQEDAGLAYSDMRIVNEHDEVQAESYWQGRKNEYQDISTVFMANTVTGAASLFHRRLLPGLLPFPQRVGDAFHDHWLALVAMSDSSITYVDEPLYDYYQYGTSVIGHCDFVRWSTWQRLASVFKLALRLLKPSELKPWLGQKMGSGLAVYRGECLRLKLFSQTLNSRYPESAKAKTLAKLTEGGLTSFRRLLGLHVRILKQGKTTDDAEFRLALAHLSRVWHKRKFGLR